MSQPAAFWIRIRSFFCLCLFLLLIALPCDVAWGKRPPETRNQEELQISQDMHGQDLSGYEFVKTDLRGIDLSETNLTGAVFNNSQLQGANLQGADLKDALAYASDFEKADLRNTNFTNALLMESTFIEANIEGADFTGAVISRIQQKKLCAIADGTNTNSGIDTTYSLNC